MNPMDSLAKFKGTDRNEYRFVKTIKDDIQVWKEINECKYECGKLDLSVVNEGILTDAGIWDKLSNKIQKAIILAHGEKIVEVKDRMEHARKNRRKKYDFSQLPSVLVCSCGVEVEPNYYQMQKKADKKQVPLGDLVKNFKCKTCNPVRRGRQASQSYEGVPDQLECKCGHIVKYPPSAIISMAKKKGKTVDKFVKGYVCQGCCKTRGRKKKK